MYDLENDAILSIQSQQGITMGETTRTRWELPVYVVIDHNDKDYKTYFDGETAYDDASRYYYDLVIPLVYGKGK
jgi:hypothetical protein